MASSASPISPGGSAYHKIADPPENKGFWKDALMSIQTSFASSKTFSATKNPPFLDLTTLFFAYVGLTENKAHLQEEILPVFDTACLTSVHTVSNFSSLSRSLLGICNIKTPLSQLLGESSALSAVAGGTVYVRAKAEHEEAAKGVVHQDEKGMCMAAFKEYGGMGQLLSGIAMTLNRSTSLLIAFGDRRIQKNQAIKGLSFGAGVVGGALGAFTGFAMTLWSSFGLRDSLMLFQRVGFNFIRPEPQEAEIIASLQKEVHVDHKALWEQLKSTNSDAELKALLEKEVDSSVKEFLLKAASFSDKPIPDTLIEQMVQKMLANILTTKFPEGTLLQEKNLNIKQQLGLFLVMQRKQEINEIEMRRLIGEESLHMLLGDPKDIDVSFIRNKLIEMIGVQTGVLFMGVLSTIAAATGIASYFILQSPLLLVSCILSLFCSMITVVFDGMALIKELQSVSYVGWQDKVFVSFELLLGVACLAGVIALSAASMGTFPVIVALAAGSVWVGIALFNVYLLRRKEVLYQEEHISIEALQEKLLVLRSRITVLPQNEQQKEIENVKNRALLLWKEGKQLSIYKERIEKIDSSNLDSLDSLLQEWKQKEQAVKDSLKEAVQMLAGEDPSEEISCWQQLIDSFSWLQMGAVPQK